MKHSKSKFKHFFMYKFGLHACELRFGCLCSAIMLLVFMIISTVSGSPYRIYFLFQSIPQLPPFGVYAVLNLIFTVGLGFAFGIVFCKPCSGRNAEEIKCHASISFVLLAVLWFAVYALIVRGSMFFWAFLCLCVTWVLSLYCMLFFSRFQILSGCVLLTFLLWITHLILTLLRFALLL